MGDWIRMNYRRDAGREAFVGTDGRVTFGEAAERAWRLGRGLRAAGVGHGDVVGVLAGNRVFNAELFLGVGVAGGLYGAFNWRWAAEELAAAISQSETKIIIVQDEFQDLLQEALQIISGDDKTVALPRVVEQGEVEKLRIGSGELEDIVQPSDGLCLIYTGGSTGTAKAVIVSHTAATANGINEHMDLGIGAEPEERGLLVTPMFHSAGLLTWLFTHFISCKTTILVEKFSEDDFVEWATRERGTNSFMIPNMMRTLMLGGVFKEPSVQKHFKAMHTGAGLLRMPHKRQFLEEIPDAKLFFRYGLSEAGPMVTRLHHRDILDESVDGSIGQEYSLVETKLLSPDGSGQEVPNGELGEIVVRGPNVMNGYHNNPEATEAAYLDGWLLTGDLAIRDDRGYYFFKDRLKEMIKTGGENVYCAEVEQALYMHAAVQEAAVVGVPNDKWGEEVRAVVSFKEGSSATATELSSFLREQLAGYKIPKEFVFMPASELPRSGAGKLVKERLKTALGWA